MENTWPVVGLIRPEVSPTWPSSQLKVAHTGPANQRSARAARGHHARGQRGGVGFSGTAVVVAERRWTRAAAFAGGGGDVVVAERGCSCSTKAKWGLWGMEENTREDDREWHILCDWVHSSNRDNRQQCGSTFCLPGLGAAWAKWNGREGSARLTSMLAINQIVRVLPTGMLANKSGRALVWILNASHSHWTLYW
jgi:hypothetical protein